MCLKYKLLFPLSNYTTESREVGSYTGKLFITNLIVFPFYMRETLPTSIIHCPMNWYIAV